jgi:hypothetical protein
VVIWRPERPSAELEEALFRLQGELLAVGLEVAIVERPTAWPSEPSGAPAPKAAAARDGVAAIVEVVRDDASMAFDIWVSNRDRAGPDVSRVMVEKDRGGGPKALAIRAIEVLRSRLVEFELASRRTRPASLPAPVRDQVAPRPPPPRRLERIGLEAGAVILTSLDGVGPAVLPLVRVDLVPSPALVVQATLAGLGSRPRVTSLSGTAEVRQDYGMLGLCYCSPSAQGLRPFIAGGAGVLRTSLTGRASPPGKGHRVEQWSFVLDGGLGASLGLPDRFYLTLASHVQLAEPYVSIHFADTVVASTGRPNLLFSLTVGAWL